MATTPRTPNVVPTKVVAEATPDKVGKAQVRDLSDLAGPIDPLIIEPTDADALENQTKLDRLKFAEDILQVTLLPSGDKSAPAVVTVWNNGRPFYFKRGVPTKVARKYVEVLAQARPLEYTVSSGIDPSTKEAYNMAVPTMGLRHPFQVNYDPAGERGVRWLEQLLAGA